MLRILKSWKTYLNKERDRYTDEYISDCVDADIAVVIPCYDEPDIQITIDSLRNKAKSLSGLGVLVIVVVNSGENSKEQVVAQNRATYKMLKEYCESYSCDNFNLATVICEDLPRKHAGVGLARRIGMNIAVEYFLSNANEKGIIVSLDADCKVSDNFFTSMLSAYKSDSKLICTIQNVKHRIESYDARLNSAIRQYETYLSYFSNSLRDAGFPYYLPTVGSAFSVTADAYVKVGGMGRQQGGEDFYFLQKIFQLGKAIYLDNTYVYPLARFSDRVPFGTGPTLHKIISSTDGVLRVYSPEAFDVLKTFFDIKGSLYKCEDNEMDDAISSLPMPMKDFLTTIDFKDKIVDCNQNCANIDSFTKRFFHHFNAFQIIKFLNFVHPKYFELVDIDTLSNKSYL
ncbi:MAG: glycosyltransferase [Fermentimonas sp.]